MEIGVLPQKPPFPQFDVNFGHQLLKQFNNGRISYIWILYLSNVSEEIFLSRGKKYFRLKRMKSLLTMADALKYRFGKVIDLPRPFPFDIFPNRELIQSGKGKGRAAPGAHATENLYSSFRVQPDISICIYGCKSRSSLSRFLE